MCQRQNLPISDFGLLSYFARNGHFGQLCFMMIVYYVLLPKEFPHQLFPSHPLQRLRDLAAELRFVPEEELTLCQFLFL